MKPRATTHAGHGSIKHNFREFPKEAKGDSDINRDLSGQNKFFLNSKWLNSESEMQQYMSKNKLIFNRQKERFKDDSRYKNLSLSEKYELLFYEKAFDKTINNQHERNAIRRQQCLDRNAIDMLTSKKTQPEETIFQIGDLKNCPDVVTSEGLWDIYKDYQKEHNKRFGAHIKVIDAVLHQDEGSFHIHERKVFIGLNSHDEAYPGKESALTLLGIERPDKTKNKNRFNNRKQTYSAECRKIWLDVCREHGIEVETTPREYADKQGLTIIEYKVQQEQNKLQSIINKQDKATSNLVAIDSRLTNKQKAEQAIDSRIVNKQKTEQILDFGNSQKLEFSKKLNSKLASEYDDKEYNHKARCGMEALIKENPAWQEYFDQFELDIPHPDDIEWEDPLEVQEYEFDEMEL